MSVAVKEINQIDNLIPFLLLKFRRSGTVPSTGIIYHGGQSSTSSDLSPPMSDQQKSLPRRGRSRYHLHHINTNTTPRHKTKSTLNSPLTSPRNCSNLPSSIQNQIVANSNQYSMPTSQFRPIHSTRTINLTKAIPKLSPNC